MNIKQLIKKLQELAAKYGEDMNVCYKYNAYGEGAFNDLKLIEEKDENGNVECISVYGIDLEDIEVPR